VKADGTNGARNGRAAGLVAAVRKRLRRRYTVPYSQLRRGGHPVRFAIGFLVMLAIVLYFAIEKRVPFTHGYRFHAIFSTGLDLPKGTPVRVAGVDAGSVVGLKRYGQDADVTMEIEGKALPIHANAQLKIRPRTFLEGSWFIELEPGTANSPVLHSGATIPITQTAVPVQLENVLDALNSEARSDLQELVIEYGRALAERPNPAENEALEPEERNKSAAEALDQAATHGPISTRNSAIVNEALAGTHERDLSTLVEAVKRLTAALDTHPQELGELFPNFNTFFEELSNNANSLHETVAELPGAFSNIHNAFVELGKALPALRSFSEAITPGVEETPATVAAFLPWIREAQALFGPSELGGIAKSLKEGAPGTQELISEQIPFLKQNDLFSRCLTNVLIPAGNARLQDGPNTSGETAYREFWYSLVGANSIGQSFSGNGLQGLRSLVGGGGTSLRSQPTGVVGLRTAAGESLVTRAFLPPLGTRPIFTGEQPPYRPLVPCYTQKLPEFNGPLAGPGPADGSLK